MPDEAREIALALLMYGVAPALVAAAVLSLVAQWLGGGSASSAFGWTIGSVVGLLGLATVPLLRLEEPKPLVDALRIAMDSALVWNSGDTSWNRLPWVVLAALCVERLARAVDKEKEGGWFLRGGAAFAMAWWLIPEALREERSWLVPAFAGNVFVLWQLLQRLAAKPPGGSVPLCLALNFIGAGILLVHAGIIRFMEPAIIAAAALAGVSLFAIVRGADASGVVSAAAVLLPGLLLMGQQNTSVEAIPWSAYALLAAAPLVLVLTLPLRKSSSWLRYVVQIILILLPIAAALAIAQQGVPFDMPAGPEVAV